MMLLLLLLRDRCGGAARPRSARNAQMGCKSTGCLTS
jgi:hypothetical protein